MLREGGIRLLDFDLPQMLDRVLSVAAGPAVRAQPLEFPSCQLPGAHVSSTASKSIFFFFFFLKVFSVLTVADVISDTGSS